MTTTYIRRASGTVIVIDDRADGFWFSVEDRFGIPDTREPIGPYPTEEAAEKAAKEWLTDW